MNATRPIILAHGGAGSRAMTLGQSACLRAALQVGYSWLDRGSSALLAVEQTIRVLERSGLFNAGNGSKLQLMAYRGWMHPSWKDRAYTPAR
ncbi:MAG: isoaspartyl peptidase/L-asparaginase [Nitrospira sp.]|nr:isoaspartyl peptidase/L-asparaginase [Nitrospira sp.]